MKKIFFAIACMTIISCEQTDMLENNISTVPSVSQNSLSENVIEFKSKEDLAKVIKSDEDLTRSTVSMFKTGGKFISMMDEIDSSYEHWNEFSEDEKKCIVDEKLTYYEALGYADLVPNENFAKLLNNKGEIIVDDSLYRITPIGTFCADTLNSKDIDACYNRLVNSKDTIKCNADGSVKLSSNVTFYNSFAAVNKSDFNYNSTRAGGYIPLKYYGSNASSTWVGGLLASIFGDRSTKEYEYISKRKINASLYDYNYGVYYESGALVYTERKRGGWFSWINGWKNYDADELGIELKNIVFELDFKTPSHVQFPKELTFVCKNTVITSNLSDKPIKTVDICGYDIDYKMIANALKFGAQGLSSLFNDKNIPSDVGAVRILTPNVMYIVLADCSISKKNTHQIRKVFNSGVNFFVSSTIISDPLSIKSIVDVFNGTRSLPVKHIKEGRAIFTSKIDGSWGGIVIDKNYTNGGKEYIYK